MVLSGYAAPVVSSEAVCIPQLHSGRITDISDKSLKSPPLGVFRTYYRLTGQVVQAANMSRDNRRRAPTAQLPRIPVLVDDGSHSIQPKLVVHGLTEFLSAAQAAFRRLYRDVTREKLDLFQFHTCQVT